MAINKIGNLLKELDRVAATTIYNGPKKAAERIVKDLQEIGPAWTGQFSNSWQIETPVTTVKGSGAPGKPQQIIAPVLTGRQVTRSLLTKNKLVFTISNYAPYADVATDYAPGVFINPGTAPIKPIEETGRRQKGIRGLLTGEGNNSRTAPLDWFTLYVKGGNVQKTIEIAMRTTDR